MKNIFLIIGITAMILLSGCQSYSPGTYQTHPCEAPYTNNISCEEAKACSVNRIGEHIIESYINDHCINNRGDN